MKEYREHNRFIDPKELLEHCEVSGTRYREEFSKPLYNAENDRFADHRTLDDHGDEADRHDDFDPAAVAHKV